MARLNREEDLVLTALLRHYVLAAMEPHPERHTLVMRREAITAFINIVLTNRFING
jgi:hypothetical protein